DGLLQGGTAGQQLARRGGGQGEPDQAGRGHHPPALGGADQVGAHELIAFTRPRRAARSISLPFSRSALIAATATLGSRVPVNAIAGPRSRCPSRYRKSLTISPRVSRYQFSAAPNRVLPSTTCPSRWISAGPRTGRWVPLTRTGPAPKFSAIGTRSVRAGYSG